MRLPRRFSHTPLRQDLGLRLRLHHNRDGGTVDRTPIRAWGSGFDGGDLLGCGARDGFGVWGASFAEDFVVVVDGVERAWQGEGGWDGEEEEEGREGEVMHSQKVR